ncbi:hypothetical protein OG943_08185 [Amycolatopsis sp. NBC_00345]|uniref:hypothetical protein n=1 Tax=Amycolatopsis sp. NBC_00345 TaxID=2975955 RepID=UPI002E2701C9
MAALTEAALLGTWEAALGLGAVRRALTLAVAGGAEPATVADLAVGHRDGFLLALRENWFGPGWSGLVTCPACAEELELELSDEDVRAVPPAGASAMVAAGGYEVEFRPVTSRDLLAIRREAPDARRRLLERCVVAARSEGREVPAPELPDAVLAALPDALSTEDPQADVRLGLDCAACGHHWAAPFDIGAYLWTELDVYARRLLHEVHALALGYGWSESEVLAVSPVRRRYYLELAGSVG